jgi:hypothetical protein
VRKFLLSLGFFALIVGSYYWGYVCGQQQIDAIRFESAIIEAGNEQLILDMIAAEQFSEASELLMAKFENNVSLMISLFEKYNSNEAEYIRCAVSRRVRKGLEENLTFKNREAAELKAINQYLAQECLGEPSRASWAADKKLKNTN